MAMTFTAENATEALILEQALAYARQLTRTANTAPDGHVLRLAEGCVLDRGRELLRQPLEIVLQAQAEGAEKRGRPAAPVGVAPDAPTRADPPTDG
jgi:hypothetical protein